MTGICRNILADISSRDNGVAASASTSSLCLAMELGQLSIVSDTFLLFLLRDPAQPDGMWN